MTIFSIAPLLAVAALALHRVAAHQAQITTPRDRIGAAVGAAVPVRGRGHIVGISGPRRACRLLRLPHRPPEAPAKHGGGAYARVIEQLRMVNASLADPTLRTSGLRDRRDAILVTDMSLRDLREGMSDSVVPAGVCGRTRS